MSAYNKTGYKNEVNNINPLCAVVVILNTRIIVLPEKSPHR